MKKSISVFLAVLLALSSLLVTVRTAYAALPADVSEGKEIRTPFQPNPGEEPTMILNNDYTASLGWWALSSKYNTGKPIWCMIKLGENADVDIDGFKLYNGGNWDIAWGPYGFNVGSWEFYAAGDEGDALWNSSQNYYSGADDPNRDTDWTTITTNFSKLYDSTLDDDVPLRSSGIALDPVWPIPDGCTSGNYMDIVNASTNNYPNYRQFPYGPTKAKYIVFAVTGWIADAAISELEIFGAPTYVQTTSVDIPSTTYDVPLNGSTRLTANVDGSNKRVVWSSSNESVATVDKSGIVTTHNTGSATITATSVDNGTVFDTCTVNTIFVHAHSININQDVYNAILGKMVYPYVTFTPADTMDKRVIWSSDNPDIVYIDSLGNIIASGIGTAVLTATSVDGGFTDTCTVNVSGANKKVFFGLTPSASVDISEKEWAQYKELGIKTLRIHLQAGNTRAQYDAVIDRARQEGIEVMMLVSYESFASTWDTVQAVYGATQNHCTNSSDLLTLLETEIPYYASKGVHAWEIWNEENAGWYLTPEEYASLITQVYTKCKLSGDASWDRDAVIVFGGLDAVNPGGAVNGWAKTWLEAYYNTDEYKSFKTTYGFSPFDAFAIHPYNTITVDDNLQVNYNVLEQAIELTARDVMKTNGDENVPIWLTELGSQNADPAKQAAELRAYAETAYAIPIVSRFFYFSYLYPGLNWGIVDGNYNPKPSFYEYKNVISSYKVNEPSLPVIERTIRADDKHYLFGMSPSENITDDEWNLYKEMGIKSIRLHLQATRYSVDPVTGVYDFSYYDALCKKAADLGIEINMLVSYESYPSYNPGSGYTDYANLVTVLKNAIPHFKKIGVTAYEIWNEQNGNWPVTPENYAELLSTVYEKCKYTDKWDINANIVFGGLDGMSSGRDGGIRPDVSDYLTIFYNSSAYTAFKAKYDRSPFDAIGYHNYQTIDVNNKFKLDYDVFNSSLTSVTDVIDVYGDKKMPIWLTEIGDNDVVDELQAARLKYYLQAAHKNHQVTRIHWFKHTYGAGYDMTDGERRFTTAGRMGMTTYATEIARLTGTNTQPVTGITLNKVTYTLPYLSTIQLVATVEPFNAVETDLTWTSSDDTVASVGNGFVKAKKAGTATITVTAGGYSATCDITVLDDATIFFRPGTYDELGYLVSINASPIMYRTNMNPPQFQRFADRFSTFTYKFNLDPRAKTATLNNWVSTFTQYDVWLSADNKTWVEIGNKTAGLGYVRPIDVSSYLAGGTLYFKVGDCKTSDGNGGVLYNVSLTYTY